jgi:hypothetical protein
MQTKAHRSLMLMPRATRPPLYTHPSPPRPQLAQRRVVAMAAASEPSASGWIQEDQRRMLHVGAQQLCSGHTPTH